MKSVAPSKDALASSPTLHSRLQYELVMYRRACPAAAAESGAPHPDSDDVQPHIRLVQGLSALVLPDLGGSLLAALMTEETRAYASSGVPDAALTAAAGSSVAAVAAAPASSVASGSLPPRSSWHSHTALSSTSVATVVRAVVALITKLQRLHACGLVHKALRPDFVLYHAKNGSVQFLDLSSASLLSKERAETETDLNLYSFSAVQRVHFEAFFCLIFLAQQLSVNSEARQLQDKERGNEGRQDGGCRKHRRVNTCEGTAATTAKGGKKDNQLRTSFMLAAAALEAGTSSMGASSSSFSSDAAVAAPDDEGPAERGAAAAVAGL